MRCVAQPTVGRGSQRHVIGIDEAALPDCAPAMLADLRTGGWVALELLPLFHAHAETRAPFERLRLC